MINQEITSIEDLKQFAKKLEDLSDSITNGEADNFLTNKGQKALDKIMQTEDINSEQRADDYINGNKVQVSTSQIKFYNDSVIDIESADTWINEAGKTFYPSELSLAELVEYGAGEVGAESSRNTGNEWEYMVNQKRLDPNYMLYGRIASYETGWEWENKSYPSSETPTRGQAGRYIYFQLQENIDNNLDKWVNEFITEKMGGKV